MWTYKNGKGSFSGRLTRKFGTKVSNKTLRRYCLALWSEIVRKRDGLKCISCGKENIRLNSHHLISKKILKFAYDLNNGVSLCSYCHAFSPINSPHLAGWEFENIIKDKCPEQYKWWVENRINLKDCFGYKPDYRQIFEYLKKEYNKLFTNSIIIGNKHAV